MPVTRSEPEPPLSACCGSALPPSAAIRSASRARVRGADQHIFVGTALDEFLGAGLGDQLAPADDDQMVGRDRHLIHQVAGHENGAAFGREMFHQVPDPQDALWVEAVDRLVQQQHLRVTQHGHRDADPLPHAEGVPADPLAGHLTQPDQVEHLVHPGPGQPLRLGQEEQVVVGAPARVHGLGLKQRAYRAQWLIQVGVRPAVDRRGPGVRPVQAQDEPHRGRLARAIRAQEPGDPAWLDMK